MASQGDTHAHTRKGTIVAVVKREGLGARLLWYRGCRGRMVAVILPKQQQSEPMTAMLRNSSKM